MTTVMTVKLDNEHEWQFEKCLYNGIDSIVVTDCNTGEVLMQQVRRTVLYVGSSVLYGHYQLMHAIAMSQLQKELRA